MKRDETGCWPVATRESNSDHKKASRLSIPPTSPTESGPKLHCPCIKVSFHFPQGWQHRMAGVIWWWEACGLDLCFPNLSCIRITWKFVRNLLASWGPSTRVSDSGGLGWSTRIWISNKFPGEAAAAAAAGRTTLWEPVSLTFVTRYLIRCEAHLCRRRRLANADHADVSMPKGLSGYKTRTSKSTYHISQCRRRTRSDAHIASYQQFR